MALIMNSSVVFCVSSRLDCGGGNWLALGSAASAAAWEAGMEAVRVVVDTDGVADRTGDGTATGAGAGADDGDDTCATFLLGGMAFVLESAARQRGDES